jgi:uncharacterized membrane protein
MAETPTDVLVAGYPDIDGAMKDFESLGALVRDTQVSIDGVILVTHGPRWQCRGVADVRQPWSRGLGWGGGVGLAVGLFAPPLASVAVGAVAGGVIGKFVDHCVEQDIHYHSDS